MDGSGRVLQVNVSRGGVPKLPVERAWVGTLGVEGDAHREQTVHGGPHRAVCVFGIEAIKRLQSEGHPVGPGSVGENLTTAGIEWSMLPVGTRARIGQALVIEIASPTAPCATQRPNFIGGRFSRISIDLHPSDSRMYARVLTEGEVRAGDPIVVEPPLPDSRAADEQILARLDRAEAKSSLQLARAAAEAGFDVRMVDDGELAMSASRGFPGPAINRAAGLARLPNLVPRATAFFDDQGIDGWLLTEGPPLPNSDAGLALNVYAAHPEEVAAAPLPAGLAMRRIHSSEHELWTRVHEDGHAGDARPTGAAWAAVTPHLAARPHVRLLLAELDGDPVATGALYTHHGVGWLRAAMVVPRARGLGIQRALIAARARLAAEEGCALVGASSEPATISARNLEATGFRLVGRRELHRYHPKSAVGA